MLRRFQMNANPPPAQIQPPPNAPPMQNAPNQKVEIIEREKSLYEKSIDTKKKLNQLKDHIPKAKFNKLWQKASTDPFFNLEAELSKTTKKTSSNDEDIISQQKAYIKQLERLVRKLQA